MMRTPPVYPLKVQPGETHTVNPRYQRWRDLSFASKFVGIAGICLLGAGGVVGVMVSLEWFGTTVTVFIVTVML